ncbi:MFS transporter [Actinoplanes couchii]|uniref:MFS transporter n=1 Tax=Actinoplanes couchii TaxID=403638 RepID=A0ABQ3X8L5_9ACTN|nr:MFS transporter [Actinoplanes couchii]MDR6320130.1 EmrB/QacA subfamily drug resistance transporter [Actinoplanes couchii]GID54856.1 MFS transporter [Actinoplanes couchii]
MRTSTDTRPPTVVKRPDLVVAILAFAGIVVAVMQTVVIPIVPELPRLLNAEAADTAWAITATLLAAAVATPVVGRLGDMYGKRRMLLLSLALMLAGSLVCAVSYSLVPFIAGRVLQGLAAGVIPLGISIMRDELPAERLGAATALMSASLGVGGAVGLPLAAFVAENVDWHALFWASAVLGAIAVTLVSTLVPESSRRTGGHFDLIGAIGLSAALTSMLLAVSKGATWGWGSGLTIGLFTAAAVIFLLWGFYELRSGNPLVDLRTTARPQVLFTNLAALALGVSMFAAQLIVPQLVQLPAETGYGLGRSLLTVGLVLAPQGLVVMVIAPLSARVSAAFGPKTTLMIGAAVVAAGYSLNLVLMSELWHLVLVTCIIGAGIGFAYGALPLLVMAGVPVTETAAANALNTLVRSIGGSIASAVAGVVLAQMTMTLGGHALPTENAFRILMALGAGAALLTLLFTAFLPRSRAKRAAH